MITEIVQGNLLALHQLNDLISNYQDFFKLEFILPKSTEIVFSQIVKEENFIYYHDYFNIIEILTLNKANCHRFIDIGLENVLCSLLSQQSLKDPIFDEADEDSLSFCCLHLLDFVLDQSQEVQSNFPMLSFFIHKTNISIQNKLNFIVTYSKHCTTNEEAQQISQALKYFTKYLVNDKVCQKFAWIMYYISKNNIENVDLFIRFLKKIRFSEYETNQLFLKPYLSLCQMLLRNLLTPSQDQIRIQVINYLFENQNDLFEIAYSINNHELVSSAYNLLKLIFKAKIQNEVENAAKFINLLVESKYYEDLIILCEDNETDIVESKIKFLSIIVPFISNIEKLCLIINLIPDIVDLIDSGTDYRPFVDMILVLIEKLKPYPNHFDNLKALIADNQVTEHIQSVISSDNLLDLDSLKKCNIIDTVCISSDA